jgi:hypothetical protein
MKLALAALGIPILFNAALPATLARAGKPLT